jgi:hypothetical protein
MRPIQGVGSKGGPLSNVSNQGTGPGWFPNAFFQKNWGVCGEKVTKVVLRVLNGEEYPEAVNRTFIVLIPS